MRYQWPLSGPSAVNDSILQIYSLPAVAVGPSPGTPVGAFENVSSAVGSIDCAISVVGAGSLIIDFGVELPAWFEFDSPDLSAQAAKLVTLGISEYNAVGFYAGYKQDAPTVYGKNCGGPEKNLCTYRLETNSELYEGVRYGFLVLLSPPATPFTITALRGVAQAKPVNYVGSFSSPGDDVLERIWYTGAYTVRATLQSDYMGSILIDRGDRIGWTGDLHTTQATSMAAFGNFGFVLDNLNRTQCPDCCNGIATYCLYFVLSACDYFRATGDAASLGAFAGPIAAKLNAAAKLYANPTALRFVGHDDRLGDGFCDPVMNETQAVYRFLAIRAWRDYSVVAAAIGDGAAAAKYKNLSDTAIADLRAGGGASPWWQDLGMHAAAEALAGGWATPEEAAGIADAKLGNIVSIPSQSNFQQYFILQALSAAGLIDRGVECARVVWGSELALGATTFWEQSVPDWRDVVDVGPGPVPNEAGWSSLAHPWSSGVTAWLSAWVLGVRQLSRSHVRIAPHVAHGMTAGVRGHAPTPLGPVKVEARAAHCALGVLAQISVALPHAVSGEVILSEVTLRRLGVLSNGSALEGVRLIDSDTGAEVAFVITSPPDAPRADERPNGAHGRMRAITFDLFDGGAVSLTLHSGESLTPCAPPAEDVSPFPSPVWPGALAYVDTSTKGSWQGVHGKQGIVFFGGSSNGSSPLQMLPPWVESVTIWTPKNSGFNGNEFAWEPSPQDPRGLLPPPGMGDQRILGAAAPSGSGSFPIDVILAEDGSAPPHYQVALYYVDFGPTPWGDGQTQTANRTQEAYLLQLPSLDPLSKRVVVSDFSGGVWHIYNISGSFRIRTTTMRGDYAVISALAFE